MAGGEQAARAWERDVNSRGGLNCHPVQVVVANVGDQASALSAARRMVEEQGVIAFMGNLQPLTVDGITGYLEQHSIPLVGGDVVHDKWFTSPMLFTQGSGNDATFYGFLKASVEAGKPKVAWFTCVEAAACTLTTPVIQRQAPRAGAEIVYVAQISLVSQDFTAQCLEAQRRGAQAIALGGDASTIERIVNSCTQQGFKPLYITSGLALLDSLSQNPSLDGMLGAAAWFPWVASDTPNTRQFQRAMSTYAPGVPLSGASAGVWTSGKLLEAASVRLPANPTSGDILNGLYALRGESLGGLMPPQTYVRGQAPPDPRCSYLLKVVDKKWTAPNGSTAACQ
jgi:branched-chain amino acid transport system substrate-binding protein